MSEVFQNTTKAYNGSEIAVVGMACRFPGARNVDEYWSNLCDGVESIKFFSERELRESGVPDSLVNDPDYVRANGVLEDIDKFDAGFFGFSPREASILDPQHRFFLECTWEALEHAGHDPAQFEGSIGVYAGSGMTAYMMYNLISNPELMHSVGEFLVRHTGNDKDFLTTRASYLFNLRGPSINVQTACSTSLVAAHLASQQLLSGECDMALVGGVTIQIDQEKGYLYQEGEILSPDGHCRAFDSRAQGTIFGSGVGVVVLRRLSDALEDGNTIHGIIRGSAVNNDGSGKVSYLAPSVDGQAEAIVEAIDIADVPPESVTYVEAHGTGTPVGDPIEVAALRQAYQRGHENVGYCALGSVKPNIGHLDTAAGVASLIKATLAVKNGKIPPTLHFTEPNEKLEIEKTPFYVNNKLVDWTPACGIRRAGVSSLGVGGTNAHLILEEPPDVKEAPTRAAQSLTDRRIVIPISAGSETATIAAAHQLGEYLATNPDVSLDDVVFTMIAGRKTFRHRLVASGNSIDELVQELVSRQPSDVGRSSESTTNVFMFAGGGAQHRSMGAGLYKRFSAYRDVIDQCVDHMIREHEIDLTAELTQAEKLDDVAPPLQSPKTALPALFATEYALAKLLMSLGITPGAMSGHSMGEYVAACLAGVFSLTDALSLVYTRGRLFETLQDGAMLSVFCPRASLNAYLDESVDVAAENAPELNVVAGPVEAIESLEKRLEAAEIDCQRVRINVAAHSRMVEPILKEFSAFVAGIKLNPPTIPFVSNVSGDWITAAESTDPAYWTRHIRETVQFGKGLSTILERPNPVLFEVGPGRTLATLADMHGDSGSATILTTMRHPKDEAEDEKVLVASLGRAWSAGVQVQWQTFNELADARRIPLPTYPFEKQRHWISPGTGAVQPVTPATSSKPAIEKLPDVDQWINSISWSRTTPTTSTVQGRRHWLILAGPESNSVSDKVLSVVAGSGASDSSTRHVVEAGTAATFGIDRSTIRPGQREDYVALFEHLASLNFKPTDVLHAWPVLIESETEIDAAIDVNFFGLLYLAQAALEADVDSLRGYSLTRSSISTGDADPVLDPHGALVSGPCTVLAKELPSFKFQQLDIDGTDVAYDRLGVLFGREPGSSAIAIRGEEFFSSSIAPHPKQDGEISSSELVSFEKGKTYVITGGTGGVGIELAGILGRRYDASVVLLGRTVLPEQSKWVAASIADETEPEVRRRLQRLVDLSRSMDVHYFAVDVTDINSLHATLSEVEKRVGSIHGILHAAGNLDDGPALAKTSESALSVLHPKTLGAEAVLSVAESRGAEFVLLFSSTSALLSPAGQIDYVSANSYLGALADTNRGGSMRVLSTYWGMWRNLGMTAEKGSEETTQASGESGNLESIEHAIFDQAERDGSTIRYLTTLDASDDWYINEHRLWTGQALAPGTLIVELVRAAYSLESDSEPCSIDDLVFAETLSVPDGEHVAAGVELQRTNGHSFDACVFSVIDGTRRDHAFASVSALPGDCKDVAFDRVWNGEKQSVLPDDKSKQEDWLQFGPRWKCLREVQFESGFARAALELLPQYAPESETFGFHPALLDIATGFALPLDFGFESRDDLYVPITYRSIRFHKPLPAKLIAEATLSNEAESHPDFVTLDYRLLNTAGEVVAAIDGFAMKRVNGTDVAHALSGSDEEVDPVDMTLLELGSRFGIEPAEGFAALEYCLSLQGEVTPIISSVRWSSVTAVADSAARAPKAVVTKSETTVQPKSAPRDDIERGLVDLWSSLLGVPDVGTNDDFFDLGGHSLIAVRLFTKIKRTFGVDLSLATLFQAPTIAKSAQLVRKELGLPEPVETSTEPSLEDIEGANASAPTTPQSLSLAIGTEWSPLVAINPEGSKKPFFCVHGAGGNVLNFTSLSRLLGKDQPFFGLQAKGVDGKAEPSETIEEMAAEYVTAITEQFPDGPYLLGGYSGGGVVAFEMAQILERANKNVQIVVMFDTFCPSLPQVKIEEAESRLKKHLSAFTNAPVGYLVKYSRRRFLFEKNRIRKSYARFLTRFGRPLPIELREFQMITAYHLAQDRYKPRPYDGSVVLFTAEIRDPEHADLAADMGWAEWTRQLTVHQSPGHHDTLFRTPHVEVLIQNLAEVLDRSPSAAQSSGDGALRPVSSSLANS